MWLPLQRDLGDRTLTFQQGTKTLATVVAAFTQLWAVQILPGPA